MGRRALDLKDSKFGRLTALSNTGIKEQKYVVWSCLCDCGNITNVRSSHLTSGAIRSCGCINKDRLTLHNLSKSREYSSWSNMKIRCFCTTLPQFKDYGGRGISVCDRWLEEGAMGFLNFYSDMGECPSGHSLDRIDVNGNYEPCNCKWSTYSEQQMNRR